MRKLWSGAGKDLSLFGNCEVVVTEKCVDLGNGGRVGAPMPLIDD